MLLHALPDDFKLTSLWDTERSTGMSYTELVNLVDEAGNFLVDEAGNFLVGYISTTVYPQILHALPDDFKLNAE